MLRISPQTPPPLPTRQTIVAQQGVVKIASRSEVTPTDLTMTSTAMQQLEDKPASGAFSLRRAAGNFRRNLRRLHARIRATGALALTPPPPSSNTTPSPRGNNNPLLRVGLGTLMSSRACNTVLREAQESDAWAPWDGDLGAGAVATTLESLPRSRTLWDGKIGDGVRARIAGLYGVPQSSVVADASGVFVCKFGVAGGDSSVDIDDGQGGGEPVEGGAGTRRSPGARRTTADGSSSMRQHRSATTSSAGFRRSTSLVTFCVALSAGGARYSWAACLEQRGECIRSSDQGSGVIFSGKLRHASVRIHAKTISGGCGLLSAGDGEDESALEHPPVVLLRGFASILHRSVLQDSARWQWGSPAWHVDAPWVKDEDILDRVWMPSGSDVAPEATGQSPAGDEAAVAPAAAASVNEVPGNPYLERVNSTLAHRYYRQGLGGMDVPVVDPLGRPVVDLVEDTGPFLLSRLPGVAGSDETGMITTRAVLRRRGFWDRRRRQVGKAGFSTQAGTSPRMDAALQELFGGGSARSGAGTEAGGAGEESLVGVPVPPIKYVFVDPRYRGLGLGRRLFLEAMRSLARRGFRFALIVVEDNGSGGLFGFYEDMGFVLAEEQLGLPRAMIAPIPPPEGR